MKMVEFLVCPISQDTLLALDLLLNPIECKGSRLESLGQYNDQKDDGLWFE
jgi:hypothetical protein